MRLFGIPIALTALAAVVQSAALEKRDLLQDLQDQAIEALKAAESNGIITKRAECSIFNAGVRKDQ